MVGVSFIFLSFSLSLSFGVFRLISSCLLESSLVSLHCPLHSSLVQGGEKCPAGHVSLVVHGGHLAALQGVADGAAGVQQGLGARTRHGHRENGIWKVRTFEIKFPSPGGELHTDHHLSQRSSLTG